MTIRVLHLSRGTETLIDEADWPFVQTLRPYFHVASGYVYAHAHFNGKRLHRTLQSFLMNPPKGMHTDHINGDKLDNRRSNLRVVSNQRNQANRHNPSRSISGIRGVERVNKSAKNPWRAQISANGKVYHLGLFPTPEAATTARRAAELKYFGELCPTEGRL